VAEPRLLVESEARHRVFLQNLADLVFFRTVPQVTTTSPPGIFWRDVFVHSRISWWSFIESLLWHLVAAVAVWALSAGGTLPKPSYKQAYSKSRLYYYPPSRSFPARTGNSPRPAPTRARHESPRQAAMRVAREQRGASSSVAAPDARVTGHARTPNLAASNPAMPSAPLAATRISQADVAFGLDFGGRAAAGFESCDGTSRWIVASLRGRTAARCGRRFCESLCQRSEWGRDRAAAQRARFTAGEQ